MLRRHRCFLFLSVLQRPIKSAKEADDILNFIRGAIANKKNSCVLPLFLTGIAGGAENLQERLRIFGNSVNLTGFGNAVQQSIETELRDEIEEFNCEYVDGLTTPLIVRIAYQMLKIGIVTNMCNQRMFGLMNNASKPFVTKQPQQPANLVDYSSDSGSSGSDIFDN